MNVCALDAVARTPDFDSVASALELRTWEWDFLLAVDGRTTVGAIATHLNLDLDSAIGLVHEAMHRGLLDVSTMTLAAYRVRVAAIPAAAPVAAFAALGASPAAEPAKPGAISFSSDAFDWSAPESALEDEDARETPEHHAASNGVHHEPQHAPHDLIATDIAPHDTADDAAHAYVAPEAAIGEWHHELEPAPAAEHSHDAQAHETHDAPAEADFAPEPVAAQFSDLFAPTTPMHSAWGERLESEAIEQSHAPTAAAADSNEHLVTWHSAEFPDHNVQEAHVAHVAHVDETAVAATPVWYDSQTPPQTEALTYTEDAAPAHPAWDEVAVAADPARAQEPAHVAAEPYTNGHATLDHAMPHASSSNDTGGTGSISLSFSNDEPLDMEQSYEPAHVTTTAPAAAAAHESEPAPVAAEVPHEPEQHRTPTYAMDEMSAAAPAPSDAQSWKDSLSWREQQEMRDAMEAGREKEGVIGTLLRALGVR